MGGGSEPNTITKAGNMQITSGGTTITLPFEPKYFINLFGTNGNNLWDTSTRYLYDIREETELYNGGYISSMTLDGTSLTIAGTNAKYVDVYIM